MTFSGDRQPQQTPDNNSLIADLSGGLNTVSAALALPYGDTPWCVNVDIDDSGQVSSRAGTAFHSSLSLSGDNATGVLLVPYTTKAGSQLLLVKKEEDLQIYHITSYEDFINNFKLVLTFSDLWPDTMRAVKPDYAITNETNARVIFTSGICVPTQVQFVESAFSITEASSFTTIQFESILYEHATSSDLILLLNGENVVVSGAVYSGGTLTVTIASQAAGIYNVELLFVTWQWFCQAIQTVGSNVYQTVTRFHATQPDQSIAIPIDLIRNLDAYDDNTYPIIPYSSSNRSDYYDVIPAGNPDTADKFSFSTGVVYDSASSGAIVPGISHITFGAIRSTSPPDIDPPEEVHLIRGIRLDFDDDPELGITTDSTLIVLLNGEEATRIDAGNYNILASTVWGESYVPRQARSALGDDAEFWSVDGIAEAPSSSEYMKYITFDGSAEVGIQSTNLIQILYVNKSSFVSSAALSVYEATPKTGTAFPCYGIQEHASYVRGSFPRTVALFQGRLVFGGFPERPLRIVMSDTVGSNQNGLDYTNFSIANEDLEPTDPVLTEITSNANDSRITALDIASGNLIAFTKEKTFRVYASSSAVSPTNVIVGFIGNVGCVNSHSKVGVGNALFFLSLSGVYRLAPSLEIGDFNVVQQSIKTNTEFKSLSNIVAAWMAYDANDNRIYVGVSSERGRTIANELLIFNINRSAWFRYTLFNGYWYSSHCAYFDVDSSFLIFASMWDNDSQTVNLISFPYFYAMDYAVEDTWSNLQNEGLDELQSVSDFITVTPSTVNEVYSTSFRMLPFSNIKDVSGTLDNIDLQFGAEILKINQQQVNINREFSGGSSLDLWPINDLGQYPIVAFKDNIPIQQGVDYDIAITSTEVTVTFDTDPGADELIRLGYSIPSAYATPVFNRQQLITRNFIQDVFVVLDNSPYQSRFDETDVNDASEQPAAAIVGNWKRQVNLNVARVVNPRDAVDNTPMLNALGSNDLVWDVGTYSVDAIFEQSSIYARVPVSPKGSDDFFQLIFFRNSTKVFSITAYQTFARNSGRNIR